MKTNILETIQEYIASKKIQLTILGISLIGIALMYGTNLTLNITPTQALAVLIFISLPLLKIPSKIVLFFGILLFGAVLVAILLQDTKTADTLSLPAYGLLVMGILYSILEETVLKKK